MTRQFSRQFRMRQFSTSINVIHVGLHLNHRWEQQFDHF